MAERGCADVAEALFSEFGDKLSLPTIAAVVVQHRLRLHGVTRIVDPVELEEVSRQSLHQLVNTPTPASAPTPASTLTHPAPPVH
ncbi:hypothetical protein RHODO2019_19125 (plasmid) [Rhodococcus antarcticus]|jgi:hypothetical protein|uniref:ChlI/MoxR AAA lid domain-containing protein n=1 Tax=Rhodococcus antarcticus TaxID=2987751 RepID=A0ABY6P7A4_9NOCA|nr:hypothetical protein [Rhodococcus antarcticus]UZJ27043.1 hypothetical protein RHODO2019_19125 [Rhodococcus antarcticus]